ncbi:MAG TPA: hypothetical protein PLP17_08785 [Oligoflexia bacterium]|nr:hypothetical protein [Oligoflexia bacterium]
MKFIGRLVQLCLVLSLAALFVSWCCKDRLPDARDILPALEKDPIQRLRKGPQYVFAYRGRDYVIEPVAEYELWGLVVSHNDIAEFSDIYHTRDSVDIKDICVIWGDNVVDNVFHEFDFWSEPWSCHFFTKSRTAYGTFAKDQLANNHLLAEEPNVREKIARVRIGDQVHLRGKLINYYPKGASEALRKTSTTRTDTGNGACEVFMVEQVEIMKAGNPGWQQGFRWARITLIISLLGSLVLFLYNVYRPSVRRR